MLPLPVKDFNTGSEQVATTEATQRWHTALNDRRCCAILQALFFANSFSPRLSLSARALGKLTGLHHQVIRRLIRGDKRCRAKLAGLVAWQTGGKGQKTCYWLTPEGRKVAELWAKGFNVGRATLQALATDRERRKVAHLPKVAHQSGTPTENTMQSKDCFNVCTPSGVAKSKPASFQPIGQRPANELAKRLHRDYGIVLWVANDIVANYSPAEIEAAIALRERRNGAIYNEAGFIIYLLSKGYAQAYLRARQRPRKPPDELDWDAIATALQEALAPYGIKVDDEGFADLPNGRLALPPDPNEAIEFLRRHGLLRDRNFADQRTEPTDFATDDLPDCRRKPIDSELTDRQNNLSDDSENYPSLADGKPTDDLWVADEAPMEADQDPLDDDGDDDESEPLPLPACELCGRKDSEPHPALQGWQSNDFLCLSELSDDFKRRFSLPEVGLLCRGCYMTLCATLTLSEASDSQAVTDDAPKPTEIGERSGNPWARAWL